MKLLAAAFVGLLPLLVMWRRNRRLREEVRQLTAHNIWNYNNSITWKVRAEILEAERATEHATPKVSG